MSLLRLLALRLATTAATLVLLAVTCLALLRAVPGGPFDQEKLAPPEVQAALAARYRLDQPFWVQAGDYLGGALRGDLGPSFQYALPQAALLLRVLVENLQAALASPPCIAALARGYGRARVVWRHALPLAAAQSLGFLGPVLVALLTGSAIVETVFAIPGLGRTLVGAALNRDYTLLLGAVLCVALIVAAINLVVDLLQWGLDPRVRG